MPKRIQRKRTKGWKMPKNTVYVGRPSRWGNPYTLKDFDGDLGACLAAYRGWLRFQWIKHGESFYYPLVGKDLACWCPLNKRCHADILLEMVK